MNLINSCGTVLVILSILHALLSIVAKIILKINGYKINYLVTKFFYESKILKEICKDQGVYYPILIAYNIISILFISGILFVILLVFIH